MNEGGTTTLIGTPVVDQLGQNWTWLTASVEADDTNDALVIRAGNIPSAGIGTIRWVAVVRTVEVAW